MSKPKVGIFGLTGCAGCQLAVLNCEDELLDLVELIDIRSFIMAASEPDEECELDVALVEGAVCTPRDEEIVRKVRQRSKLLIAFGTCATWGGVASAGRAGDFALMMADVYGSMGREYNAVRSRPLRDVVKVDASITGCPIEKHEFLAAIANLLRGQLPTFPTYPVCTECKMLENNCLLMNDGAFCCGPVTASGCHARCPSVGVACVGCRGPSTDANFGSAANMFVERGFTREDVQRRLFAFVGGAS